MESGTKENPWQLTTAPGTATYTMYRDEEIENIPFGQKVKTILNINDHKIKVKLNFLNSGIYFYELRLSDNKIEAGKFIVN